MLSNKYLASIVLLLLVFVIAYNIKYFSSKSTGTAGQTSANVSQAAIPPVDNTSLLSERKIIKKDSSQWKRDPFSITPQAGKTAIVLGGIINNGGKGLALINGKVYTLNESVGSSIIKEIKKESIVISTNGLINEIFITNKSDIKERKK